MSEIEEWRPIAGYEGKYEVSNYGNVKSLNFRGTDKEQHLSLSTNFSSYLRTVLYKEGKKHNLFVHRLVAEAFIPNPENKTDVDHRDKDTTNNKVENLQWLTRSENIKKSFSQGNKISEKNKSITKEANQIISIWVNEKQDLEFIGNVYELVRTFPEMRLSQGNLNEVRLGNRNHHKGWKIKL
jgi:hypothetical protein